MAHLLLHLADDVEVFARKWDACRSKLSHERLSDVLSSYFSILHGVGQGVTFENRNSVGNSFSALGHQTASLTRGEQGEHGGVDQGE